MIQKIISHLQKGDLLKTGIAYYQHQNEHRSRLKEQKKRLAHWKAQFQGEETMEYQVNPHFKMELHRESALDQGFFDGTFEPGERAFVTKFLKEGDSFLDIGANSGYYSLLAASLVGEEGEVFGFEPSPEPFEYMEKNISLNPFVNIKPFKLAASDTEEERTIRLFENGFDAWNSMASPQTKSSFKDVKIQTVDLDSFLKEHASFEEKLALVKIDVEGWEIPVMHGARKLLGADNAPVMMVEFDDRNTGTTEFSCQDLYDLGVELGFKWYSYDAEQNVLREDAKREHYHTNLFGIKDIKSVLERLK